MSSSLVFPRRLDYDSLRRVATVCEAPSGAGCARETTLTYDTVDRVTTTRVATPAAWVQFGTDYDDLGNAVQQTYPDGSASTASYYRSGQLATATDEVGRVSQWAYDDLGRMLQEALPRQGARNWTYTNGLSTGTSGVFASQVERDEPDGGLFTTTYDFAGRPIAAIDAYNDETAWEYEGSQLRHVAYTASTGATLAHETYGYDASGRMNLRWGPVEDTTYTSMGTATPDPTSGDYAYGYTYSDAGRLLSREGPNDLTMWDWEDGAKVGEAVSGVSETMYEYEGAVPRLAASAIGSGSTWRTTEYLYDSLGRLEEAATDDGGEVITQSWTNRDMYGRPLSQMRRVDSVTETALSLNTDARGRISTMSLTTPTRAAQATYAWTNDGRLDALDTRWNGGTSWSGWRRLNYVYGGTEGELSQIENTSTGAALATFMGRDALGRPTAIDLNGGVAIDTQYDLLGRVDEQLVTAASGDWRRKAYAYDHRGRVEGVLNEEPTTYTSDAFVYDEPGWLVEERHVSSSGSREIDYTYDDAGNRLTRAESLGGTVTSTRASTYSYGNVLATVDGSAVSWNAFGETVTDHRGADIDRGGDGAEVGVTDTAGLPLYGFTRGPGGEAVEVEDLDAGGLRSFLWGAGGADFPLSTLDESGADQAYVAAEGLVLGRLDGGTFVPMATDGQGSVMLDGADFLDAPLAFGEEASVATGSPERRVWALLESLPGTPYKLPRRRLYDEETGRFASQDPIGLRGGDHRFAYVGGNPLGGVDPSGLVAAAASTGGGGAGGPSNGLGDVDAVAWGLVWDPTESWIQLDATEGLGSSDVVRGTAGSAFAGGELDAEKADPPKEPAPAPEPTPEPDPEGDPEPSSDGAGCEAGDYTCSDSEEVPDPGVEQIELGSSTLNAGKSASEDGTVVPKAWGSPTPAWPWGIVAAGLGAGGIPGEGGGQGAPFKLPGSDDVRGPYTYPRDPTIYNRRSPNVEPGPRLPRLAPGAAPLEVVATGAAVTTTTVAWTWVWRKAMDGTLPPGTPWAAWLVLTVSGPAQYEGAVRPEDALQAAPADGTAGEEIAEHAWNEHRSDFPEIGSQDELADLIDGTILNPQSEKSLRDGRKAYWGRDGRTVVIVNELDPDGGTAFRPAKGRKYFDELDGSIK